jgi:oxygen-independent coproporphyrinogen-3 oxidase
MEAPMRLTGHDVLKFDAFLPMYNWIYPLGGRASERFVGESGASVFSALRPARSRALYVHVPFCETICAFCPFVRGQFRDESVIDAYVEALLKEIEFKSRFRPVTDVPIGAIFFGGGTPSLLEPRHIRRIARALRERFDLGHLRELSFELEVKSATPERVEALVEAGVTHARFGLQTFSPEYRDLFALTATLEQVKSAAALLKESFPHVSCDILYGMNGQTEAELLRDVEEVCALGLDTIDFYPINNLVTQLKLHRSFRAANKPPLSGLTKFYMRLFLYEALREKGFLPHNGHGWVRVPKDEIDRARVVTDRYSFVYHEHVLGYPGHDLLGFGTNAVSSFQGFSVFNPASRDGYIRALSEGRLPVKVTEHGAATDACRPLALALPYHGGISRSDVDWRHVPEDVRERLSELAAHGLVTEREDQIELTRQGWEWYTSLMYYLLPRDERTVIQSVLRRALREPERDVEASGLEGFPFSERGPIALSGAPI